MTDLVTLTTAASWAWEKFGKDAMAKATDAAKEKYKEFKWDKAAETYRAKIKTLYGKVQVMGMPEPVALSEIYVDAYVLSKQTAHQRYALEELLNRAIDPEKHHEAERVGCLKLVREKGNLFILGKPGAGKTTFLKRVAFNAAEGFIDKVPIFISLKEWSDSQLELMPFIVRQFDICNFPEATLFVEKLLAAGQAIVLFDGLDEVNQADGQRAKQVLAIRDFAKKFDQAQCLITCRVAANEYTFEGFVYVEMADFDDGQVEQFVKNWFRNKADIGKKFLTEFAKEENKNLRELASSPLLLTLLCLSFQETLVFPQRRVEIYEEAIDALLKKWDASRGIKRDSVYGKLSLGHKKKMFAQVAAITFEKNEYFIKKERLQIQLTNYLANVPPHEEEIDDEVLLQTIEAQHGILTARSRDFHSFSHLTFQEYFTARYIHDNATKGTLKELLRHCSEPRWREVFLMTASLLDDATEFMQTFRNAVDNIIRDDEKIFQILTWATKRRNASETKGRVAQENYLYLALALYRTRDYDVSFDLNIDLAYARDLILDLTLAHACAQTLALARTRARARDSDANFHLTRAIAFSLHPTHNTTLTHGQALGLDLNDNRATSRTHALISDLTNAYLMAEKLGFPLLATELSEVAKSLPYQTSKEYGLLKNRIRTLILNHRDIGHEFSFTDEETEHLIAYFDANRLLKECLELATMPREIKEEILDGLFLPPHRPDENLLPE
jgi:NACHT domain